jgi:hypothetical protein
MWTILRGSRGGRGEKLPKESPITNRARTLAPATLDYLRLSVPSVATQQPGEFRPFLNRKDGKDGKRTPEIRLFPFFPNFLFKRPGS